MSVRGWFGPFRIERQVGRGGLGAVYRAVDCRSGETVALKLLPPGTDPTGTRRLQREFDALRHLSHPNIVRVLDFGDVDGIPWLSMEFVDGLALREWLGGGGRPPAPAPAPGRGPAAPGSSSRSRTRTRPRASTWTSSSPSRIPARCWRPRGRAGSWSRPV